MSATLDSPFDKYELDKARNQYAISRYDYTIILCLRDKVGAAGCATERCEEDICERERILTILRGHDKRTCKPVCALAV